jgi:hypothetical protein
VTQAGYSGTPLPRKLGLADGQSVVFVALPPELEALRDAGRYREVETATAWEDVPQPAKVDVILAFARWRRDLEPGLPGMMEAIRPAGMIWACWPKKASKAPTDLNEDLIRTAALPLGLVDVKVCAVDATWSGLKLVIRTDRR